MASSFPRVTAAAAAAGADFSLLSSSLSFVRLFLFGYFILHFPCIYVLSIFFIPLSLCSIVGTVPNIKIIFTIGIVIRKKMSLQGLSQLLLSYFAIPIIIIVIIISNVMSSIIIISFSFILLDIVILVTITDTIIIRFITITFIISITFVMIIIIITMIMIMNQG